MGTKNKIKSRANVELVPDNAFTVRSRFRVTVCMDQILYLSISFDNAVKQHVIDILLETDDLNALGLTPLSAWAIAAP